MENQERICRLCFETCDNYNTVDDVIRDLLDIMLPKIELAAIQKPVICTNCIEMLFKCFDFKAKCFYAHDDLVPLVNNQDGVKLDLKNIYKSGNENSNSVLEDQSICGFCMTPIKNCSAVFLYAQKRDSMLEEMLERCLPELNFRIIKEPVICATCHVSLEKYFQFVTNFLIVEDKIKKFKDSLSINSRSEIELNRLLQSIKREVMREADGNIIELEQTSCDHWESVTKAVEDNEIIGGVASEVGSNRGNVIEIELSLDEEVEIETDKLIIGEVISELDRNGSDIIELVQLSSDHSESVEDKHNSSMDTIDPILENEEEFTSKNILDCEIDSSYIDMNKKGTCCKKNRIVLKELIVNVENLNILFDGVVVDSVDRDFNRFEEGVVITKPRVSTRLNERKNSLKKHLLVHTKSSEETMCICDFCFYRTKDRCDLKAHLMTHKEHVALDMYKCERCSFHTKQKSGLEEHLRKHKDPTGQIKYRCDSCTYRTMYKGALKRHSLKHKNHSEVTTYRCDSCEYQTMYKGDLKRHSLKHKDPSEVTMYKCDSCEYQTMYKSDLKRHSLKHKDPSEVTMYKCDSCAYQSVYRGTLNRHLLTHKDRSEIKMYKCCSCTYQTMYSSHLNAHALRHKDRSEVTIYRCDSCTYQAIYKRNLREHLLKHNPHVTIYECASCTFKTIHRTILRKHLLIHKDRSQVTMYKCDSCTYQTMFKYDFRRHSFRHKRPSEVGMYRCNSCTFQSIYKTRLRKHLLKHKSNA